MYFYPQRFRIFALLTPKNEKCTTRSPLDVLTGCCQPASAACTAVQRQGERVCRVSRLVRRAITCCSVRNSGLGYVEPSRLQIAVLTLNAAKRQQQWAVISMMNRKAEPVRPLYVLQLLGGSGAEVV